MYVTGLLSINTTLVRLVILRGLYFFMLSFSTVGWERLASNDRMKKKDVKLELEAWLVANITMCKIAITRRHPTDPEAPATTFFRLYSAITNQSRFVAQKKFLNYGSVDPGSGILRYQHFNTSPQTTEPNLYSTM